MPSKTYTAEPNVDWSRMPVAAQDVLDLVPDLVGQADRGGALVYLNRAGRRMLGLASDEDLTGRYIHDFFPNWTVAELQPSRNGGPTRREQCVAWNPQGSLVTRDRRRLNASTAVVAHLNDEAEIEGFTVMARGVFYPVQDGALERVLIEKALSESLAVARASIHEEVVVRESLQCGNAAVLADPAQIHQLVMNLCLNSAQSMGEDGGQIFVDTRKVAVNGPSEPGDGGLRPGDYIRLTVRDNGPGLAPSSAQRLLEPALSGDSLEGGMNLGLWTVRRTVIDTGGDIFVESTPGTGTAFHVYLPVIGSNGAGPAP